MARKRKKSRAKKKAAAEKRAPAKGSAPPHTEGEETEAATSEEDGAGESRKKPPRKKPPGKNGSGKKGPEEKASGKKASGKKALDARGSGKKASIARASGKSPKEKPPRKAATRAGDSADEVLGGVLGEESAAEAGTAEAPPVDPAEDVISLQDRKRNPGPDVVSLDDSENDDVRDVISLDDSEAAEIEEVSLDEDAEEVDAADLIAATAALAEAPIPDQTPTEVTDTTDVFDISLDDDEEETDRERLIAEALAFVEQTESTDPAASPDVIDVPPAGRLDVDRQDLTAPGEEGRGGAEVAESGGSQSEGEASGGSEAPDGSEEEGDDRSDGNGAPKMSAAAFSALSAFHTEGLARVPEEIILDLGEATTDEQRDRLLAAAFAHVEMQDAVYRVPTTTGISRSRLKATSTYVILVVALIVAIVPPGFIVPAQPPRVTRTARERGVRVAMVLQAQQIEAFRVETQRLPSSLDEVATGLPGVRYVRSSSRLYQLIAYLPSGEALVYDSAAPSADFERIAQIWAPSAGGR